MEVTSESSDLGPSKALVAGGDVSNRRRQDPEDTKNRGESSEQTCSWAEAAVVQRRPLIS